MASLVGDINVGKVQTLLILGGNPAYNAPTDLDFAAALAKVPTSLHLGLYRNETSRPATWHIPQAHFLESWGDVVSGDSSAAYSVVQPMIEPLHGGKSAVEVLALILGAEAARSDSIVRKTFQERPFDPRGIGTSNGSRPFAMVFS